MRKFKNAAVASVAAVALTISGTAVANAQTAEYPTAPSQNDVSSSEFIAGSSEWGKWLNAGDAATGEQGFGDKLDSEAPAWIKAWNIGLYTLAGGIIGGAVLAGFNWLKHEGIII